MPTKLPVHFACSVKKNPILRRFWLATTAAYRAQLSAHAAIRNRRRAQEVVWRQKLPSRFKDARLKVSVARSASLRDCITRMYFQSPHSGKFLEKLLDFFAITASVGFEYTSAIKRGRSGVGARLRAQYGPARARCPGIDVTPTITRGGRMGVSSCGAFERARTTTFNTSHV